MRAPVHNLRLQIAIPGKGLWRHGRGGRAATGIDRKCVGAELQRRLCRFVHSERRARPASDHAELYADRIGDERQICHVDGGGGLCDGFLAGNVAQIFCRNTTPSCYGNYEGPYTFSPAGVTWTYTGYDCLGYERGAGKAVKITAHGKRKK